MAFKEVLYFWRSPSTNGVNRITGLYSRQISKSIDWILTYNYCFVLKRKSQLYYDNQLFYHNNREDE